MRGKIILYLDNEPIEVELYSGKIHREAILEAWRIKHWLHISSGYSIGIIPMTIANIELKETVGYKTKYA